MFLYPKKLNSKLHLYELHLTPFRTTTLPSVPVLHPTSHPCDCYTPARLSFTVTRSRKLEPALRGVCAAWTLPPALPPHRPPPPRSTAQRSVSVLRHRAHCHRPVGVLPATSSQRRGLVVSTAAPANGAHDTIQLYSSAHVLHHMLIEYVYDVGLSLDVAPFAIFQAGKKSCAPTATSVRRALATSIGGCTDLHACVAGSKHSMVLTLM